MNMGFNYILQGQEHQRLKDFAKMSTMLLAFAIETRVHCPTANTQLFVKRKVGRILKSSFKILTYVIWLCKMFIVFK